MVATEVGVQIQIFPYDKDSETIITLAGSTCFLTVRSPFDLVVQLPLVVSQTATYAYRNTVATDFPIGGTYDLQLEAAFPDGTILRSKIQSLAVDWAIDIPQL